MGPLIEQKINLTKNPVKTTALLCLEIDYSRQLKVKI